MIVVRIEFWPGGASAAKREIARARIWNDLSGTTASGNYKYVLSLGGKTWRVGRVRGFAREERSVWELLKEILRADTDRGTRSGNT